MTSTSFQPLCSSAGSLPPAQRAQGCTVCAWAEQQGRLGREWLPEGIPAGGMQVGTEAPQSSCGRMGDAASPWEPQLPNLHLTSPERCMTLPGVQGLAGYNVKFSFSRLGVYAEISAPGEGPPSPTAPLQQLAWLSPLCMHFTHSHLQGEV